MLLLSRRLSKTDSSAGNRSIGGSLALYWLCMVLAMLAAALLLLSVTGVLSRTARQFGETAALQQSNTAALFTAQMDALAAQGIELSETVGGELERFLAHRGLSFDALNDDPALIAELESLMIPALENLLELHECIQALQNQDYDNCAMVTFRHARKLTVQASPDMPWTLDGEREDGHAEVVVENVQHAIRLIQREE